MIKEYRRQFSHRPNGVCSVVLDVATSSIRIEQQTGNDEMRSWTIAEFEADDSIDDIAKTMLHGRFQEWCGTQ